MSGVWIKVGQLLSTRIDLFSVEFCRELSKLQDQTAGFDPEIAKRIIEEELRGSIEHCFDDFVEAPFAAASIGQVHRAHLRRENVWVAVKVQRPFIEQVFLIDLGFIAFIARFLQICSILPFIRWYEAVHELRHIMLEELDYRFEAAAMRRMGKTLRKHNIYVPEVFTGYSTQRLLVTEFVDAVLMNDYIKVSRRDPERLSAWVKENNINLRSVARCLIRSLYRQLFEDNLHHGDLHPGNIMLFRNSKVGLIDFGSVGVNDSEYMEKLRRFTEALITGDYAKAADITFLFGGNLPITDLESAKAHLVLALKDWGARTHVRELPYLEKSIDGATVVMTKTIIQYKITADWTFLRVRRTLATLDASLVSLIPDADYTQLIEQYFRDANRRALIKAAKEQVSRPFLTAVRSIKTADRVYENMFHEGSVFRRQAQVFEAETNKFDYFFSVVFGQVVLAQVFFGLFLFVVFLYQHPWSWIKPAIGQLSRTVGFFPYLDYQVWALVLIFDLYFFIVSVKLKKRLAQKDVT